MSLIDDFQTAAKNVQGLAARPDNETLLRLYALYKQASDGDVQGSRPGALNLVGRRKYDAWAERKGMSRDTAMQSYISLVKELLSRK